MTTISSSLSPCSSYIYHPNLPLSMSLPLFLALSPFFLSPFNGAKLKRTLISYDMFLLPLLFILFFLPTFTKEFHLFTFHCCFFITNQMNVSKNNSLLSPFEANSSLILTFYTLITSNNRTLQAGSVQLSSYLPSPSYLLLIESLRLTFTVFTPISSHFICSIPFFLYNTHLPILYNSPFNYCSFILFYFLLASL